MKWYVLLIILSITLLFYDTKGRTSDFYVIDERGSIEDQKRFCRTLGYDGLAILDTPEKWAYAVRIMKEVEKKNILGLSVGLKYQVETASVLWDDGTPFRSDVPIDARAPPSVKETLGRLTVKGLIKFSDNSTTKHALCGYYQGQSPNVQESWGTIGSGPLNTATSTVLSVTKPIFSYPECALMCGMTTECRAAEYKSDLKTCTLLGDYASGGPVSTDPNVMTYVRETFKNATG